MYHRIKDHETLKGKVKLIDVGAGNSQHEIRHFKKKYKIPFPLFPDGNFVIHRKLGEFIPPYFIRIQIKADGSHNIFYSKLGGSKFTIQFLEKLLQNSDLM